MTVLKLPEPKSGASTNSATPARALYIAKIFFSHTFLGLRRSFLNPVFITKNRGCFSTLI